MIRYKLPFLFLIFLASSTKCEIARKETEDKYITEKNSSDNSSIQVGAKQSKNDTLFMTKLKRWIHPSKKPLERKNDKDQATSSAEFGGYQYLPPPSPLISDHDRECSPCNLEPWIPIVGHTKHNYIPHEFSSPVHSLDSILINNQYSGLYGTPPKGQYGVPKPLLDNPSFNHGVPNSEYAPPKPQYGSPKPDYVLPKPDYGSPKPEYGPPKPNYDPPKFNYGPPKPQYSPPKQQYGPPKPKYSPPKLQYEPSKQEYGAPPPLSGGVLLDYMLPPPIHYQLPISLYGPPKSTYGLPPRAQYGVPSKLAYESPPKQLYGPPPKPLYAPPPKPMYGPPPIPLYGSPPKPLYEPPSLYGPPKENNPLPSYGPPNREYGAPIQDFTPPKPEYGPPNLLFNPPPKQEQGLISSIFEPPLQSSNQNLPPVPQNIKPADLQPLPESFSNSNNLQDPISQDFVPPPLSLVGNSPAAPDNSPQFNDNSAQELSRIPLENGFIPPPVPSDSYGNPITNDAFDFNPQLDSLSAPSGDNKNSGSNGQSGLQNNHLNLPNGQDNFPTRQLDLQNLSPVQVLPIYDFRNFQGQQNNNPEQNVQVQQSVKVADFVASVEHPINIVQSPLVELQINEDSDQNYANNIGYNRNAKTHYPEVKDKIENFKLSENPIVVEDTHSAASNINNNITNPDNSQKRNIEKHESASINLINNNAFKINKAQNEADLIKQLLIENGILGNPETEVTGIKKVTQSTTFKPPVMNYNDWIPKYYPPTVTSSMVPPPVNGKSVWVQGTTQKPLQIIVPYTNKMPQPNSKGADSYTTLVPVYTPPMPTESSDWFKYLTEVETTKLSKVTGKPFMKPTTTVYNIKDLIAANSNRNPISEKLPYDIISLQKNIDDWTHQSFSRENKSNKVTHPKQIPGDFFTTKLSESSTKSNEIFDHLSAESSRKETAVDRDIKTNFIVAAEGASTESSTTPLQTTTEENRNQSKNTSWKSAYLTVNSNTKEKVYVVTPQAYSFVTASPANGWSMAPRIRNGTSNNTTLDTQRFSIRIEPQSKESRDKMQKNKKSKLKVIYSEWPHIINNLQTTTAKPTSGHPLFGLMGITSYTPPLNSTVETFLGHSKVVTVVTPSSKIVHLKSSTSKSTKKR